MLRILRAFAWLRWRILLNSLERRGSRDVIERFSSAFEQLAPVVTALVMVPSVLALAGAGVYAGWALAEGELRVLPFEVLRFLLLAAIVLAVIGPILLPGGERTNAVRLLLLPIPRALLYVAQSISALADPWMIFVLAIVLSIPLGLAAGGALQSAAIGAAAGALLLAVLAGISLVVTSLLHLAVRNRRRGEILTLVVILALPALGLLPAVVDGQRRSEARADPEAARAARGDEPPGWWLAVERHGRTLLPSEVYARTIRTAADGRYGGTLQPLAGLAAGAAVLHGLAYAAFVRAWSSPGAMGSGARSGRGSLAGWRVPGVAAATSAIAVNQLRLALRTPRGRSIVLSPVIVLVMFAAVMWRSQSGMEFGFLLLRSGIGLATFTSAISLISILPLAMNQFAVDRAGLTLVMVAPVDTPVLLRGKAIGNALIAAIPITISVIGALALFPTGHPALWLSIPLALIATYLLAAPAAAALSAIFPRAVNLNSIGRGSNAHGAAGLLGTLSFAAAGVPCVLLVLLATRVLRRPALTPIFLLLWAAVCAGLAAVLFRAVAVVFDRRRENLGMVN